MRFTPEKVREQFHSLTQFHNQMPVTFLDGPGGSQVPKQVIDAMGHYLGRYNSNLGGHYFSSQQTVDVMQKARCSAQALLNAESDNNIVFGANMTSLTFQLSRSISRDWQQDDEVIVTALDHYSNVSSWQQAADDKGVNVHQVRLDEHDCTLDIDHLETLISNKTKLIAVTYASNTTGSMVDIERVVELAKRVNAMVYVDAVHCAPHHLIDVQELGCDFLVCSAYKFFGPHLGIAYVSPKWLQRLQPYKVEPATELGPGRFETGTQNFEALAGFIETVNYLAQWAERSLTLRQRLIESFKQYTEHEARLSEHFLLRLKQYPDITLFGINDPSSLKRTPTFALRVKGIEPELIARSLGEQNICVWNGHFYALGLVRQLGIEKEGGVVRVGFMHYNTLDEVDRFFDALAKLL
jgi:cysteine desulfurase family protein (TIGR01976 family)